MKPTRRRHLELEHYRRIIECTARQIANQYGTLEAERSLRVSSDLVRKEVVKQMESRS